MFIALCYLHCFSAKAVNLTVSSDLQLPMETTTLLHEPGKLPEQSGFYAPKPFAYSEKSPEENHTKVTIFDLNELITEGSAVRKKLSSFGKAKKKNITTLYRKQTLCCKVSE